MFRSQVVTVRNIVVRPVHAASGNPSSPWQSPTAFDRRCIPAKRWGSPKIGDSVKAVANIGVDLGDDKAFYAFGNYASREVETAFFFRSPMNRNGMAVTLGAENVFDEYPDETINYGNGRRYPRYSPAGYNGALVFAKVSLSMP